MEDPDAKVLVERVEDFIYKTLTYLEMNG